jgi:hypothetical protein
MTLPKATRFLIAFSDGKEIKEAFKEGQLGNETGVYLGSFLTNEGDLHEDELVMWRTYGKGEESGRSGRVQRHYTT